MGVGNNIKKLRLAHNMKQSELGEKLHVSGKAVSSWETGRTEPNIGIIEAICRVFNCKKTDIIGFDTDYAVNEDILIEVGRNDDLAQRLKKYFDIIQTLSPECQERVFDYIEFQKEQSGK